MLVTLRLLRKFLFWIVPKVLLFLSEYEKKSQVRTNQRQFVLIFTQLGNGIFFDKYLLTIDI